MTQAAASADKPQRLSLTSTERRASIMLALLFASRMLGLFLLTPVFAVAAQAIPGGNDATRVGLALGAYGLTQAIMQIPLGMASDRYGRRVVIVAGMVLFVVGGIVCALAENVNWIIAGRTLQGLGAVSAAITAWVADATRPEVRTRAMAMVGASIGLSFAASLVLSPMLVGAFGLSGLFWVISLLGFVCLLIAAFAVPGVPRQEEGIVQARVRDVLGHVDLLRLNFGVFVLHGVLMAMFIVMPGLLAKLGGYDTGSLWKVYLPVICLSFVAMVPAVFYTETRRKHKRALEAAVLGMGVVLVLIPPFSGSFAAIFALLVLFFVSFNILEALQPSLVSRVAPPAYKGLALGFYNTSQSLGVFAGGVLGGLLAERGSSMSVFWVSAVLTALWLLTALGMRQPTAARGG